MTEPKEVGSKSEQEYANKIDDETYTVSGLHDSVLNYAGKKGVQPTVELGRLIEKYNLSDKRTVTIILGVIVTNVIDSFNKVLSVTEAKFLRRS